MSAVKFCDKCRNPFSATEIGSQKINALEMIRENGRLSSTQYEYDLCAADAIRPAVPNFETNTVTQTALEK